METDKSSTISVVIPIYNEEGSIQSLIREIAETQIANLVEVIIVDDGSDDNSVEAVRAVSRQLPSLPVHLLRHKTNSGQTAALDTGFQYSSGSIVIALDGDGQNDPKDIPALIKYLLETNSECVSGNRGLREGDRGLRLVFSRVANRLLRRATGVEVSDFGCTLKAYSGPLIRNVALKGDMHRLIPFFIAAAGGKVTELAVAHRPRIAGASKYGLSRTWRVLQDIFSVAVFKNFSGRPMHLFGNAGMLLVFLGALSFLAAILQKILGLGDLVQTPLVLIGVFLSLGGINLLATGFLSELIAGISARQAPQRYFEKVDLWGN